MAKKNYITLTIETSQIRNALGKLVHSVHADLITDVIMNNLATTEVGLEQLYNAFSGIKLEIEHKVLDNVLIDITYLNSWNIDKDKSFKAGLIHQGKMKGRVKSINPEKLSSIEVEYEFVNDQDQKLPYTWEIQPKHVEIHNEEFPLDIVVEDKSEDLPF